MQKPPVTISIVPSRLALGLHLGLALGAWLISLVYAPPWLSAAAALCLGVALWGIERRRPRAWQLRWSEPAGTGGEWQLRATAESEWRRCALACDYLGPWLVGLRLDGESHWLWPDSLHGADGRALRRLLVAEKGQPSRAR